MSKANYKTGKALETAAKATLRAVPRVMQAMRAEMRASRTTPLSVPQFRALNYVGRHAEASLSDVAAHVGVTLPSMSRLVDGLVARKLVARRGHAADRRRLTLRLTTQGEALLQAAYAFTEASLASRLATLDDRELAAVTHAMDLLHRLFTGDELPGQPIRIS